MNNGRFDARTVLIATVDMGGVQKRMVDLLKARDIELTANLEDLSRVLRGTNIDFYFDTYEDVRRYYPVHPEPRRKKAQWKNEPKKKGPPKRA